MVLHFQLASSLESHEGVSQFSAPWSFCVWFSRFKKPRSYCGWTQSISHHLGTVANHCSLVFTGDSSFQGFLGGARFRPSTVFSTAGTLGESCSPLHPTADLGRGPTAYAFLLGSIPLEGHVDSQKLEGPQTELTNQNYGGNQPNFYR